MWGRYEPTPSIVLTVGCGCGVCDNLAPLFLELTPMPNVVIQFRDGTGRTQVQEFALTTHSRTEQRKTALQRRQGVDLRRKQRKSDLEREKSEKAKLQAQVITRPRCPYLCFLWPVMWPLFLS